MNLHFALSVSICIPTLILLGCSSEPTSALNITKTNLTATDSVLPHSPTAAHWDTLIISSWPGCYVPLSAYLNDSAITPTDRDLIKSALLEKKVPVDSIWIQVPKQLSRSGPIELDLYHISGLRKQQQLAKTGTMMQGNWSGYDGTLTIDRLTEKSTYACWQ